MAERNDDALDILDSFLDRNKEGLAKAKKENPMLHNVILDAIVLLNKRYGNENIDKDVIIEQTKVEEPVEEQSVVNEEVVETSSSQKSTLDFNVGDKFYHNASKKDIYTIDEINEDTVIVHTNYGFTHYNLEDVIRYFANGIWIKLPSHIAKNIPNFKVGDKFTTPTFTTLDTYIEVTSIGGINAECLIHGVGSTFSLEIDTINQHIKDGFWVQITPQAQSTPTPTPKPKQKTAQGTSSALKKKADRLQKDIKEIEDLLADGLLDNDQETQDDLKKMKDELAEILTKI
jgi:hypothetical protein